MAEEIGASTNVTFQYFKIKEITLDPTDIVNFDIFESLEFPGVTGKLIFKDFNDFKERHGIFAGDLMEVSFNVRGDTVDPLVLELAVYASYNDSPGEGVSNVVTLDVCSPWLIEGFTKKRSRSWTNKRISDIVAELVHECSGNSEGADDPFKDPLIGSFDNTSAVLERFVSPYWSPIETIQYLMKQAVSVDGFGGYVLWTDIYNPSVGSSVVNFRPITALMTSENSYELIPFRLEMSTTHEFSNRKIHEMSLEQAFDVVKYGKTGIGRSQLIGFDYDKSKVMRSDLRIDLLEQNHLSTTLPLNKKYLGQPYRQTNFSYTYPNTTNLITNDTSELQTYLENKPHIFKPSDLIKGQLKSKMAYMYADMLKLNAFVNGETYSKRVGSLIEVVYPRVDQTAGRNEQYSGWYLIRNNRHVIQGMQYANILTLASDGYNVFDRKEDDLIKWNQSNFPENEGDIYDVDPAVDPAQAKFIEDTYGDKGDLEWPFDNNFMGVY